MVSNAGIKNSQKVVFKAAELVLGSIISLCEKAADLSVNYDEVWDDIEMGKDVAIWSREKFRQTLYGLEKNDYIAINHENQSVAYTNKAKLKKIERFVRNRLEEDCYRFVSFDIPEILRRQRDAFRRALKRIGFIQIQKSLWVINKDVGDLVELAAYEYKVEKYVVYLVSSRSDIDGIIKKKLVRVSKKDN
jgi:DNA-binding transcriptional regulator PaaX